MLVFYTAMVMEKYATKTGRPGNSREKAKIGHTWDLAPKDAISLQKELAGLVSLEDGTPKEIRYIAGADVSMNRYEKEIFAGIVVLDFRTLEVAEYAVVAGVAAYPYIPGLLSFREAPALIDCWNKLKVRPDVLLLDGQGIAHPRGLGIAAHIGVLLDVPTIGCAKSLLYGKHGELGEEAGDSTGLYDVSLENVIGTVLRSKRKTKPIIISPGHKVSVARAQEIVRLTIEKHRLPEPTRQAHLLVNGFRRGELR